MAAVRTFGENGASFVAWICLMKGRRLCKGLSFTIGIGDRRSAFGTGRKATVYAVAVRIVGDEKHSPLGIGGRDETEAKRGDEADQRCPHKVRPTCWGSLFRQCGQIVKRCLSLQSPERLSIFSRVSHQFHHHLDVLRPTNHCAVMNGLNHICGICPEIIR
jgi:hypothetical protein